MANSLLIIAEAGVNHNGSIERALEMVDVAADAGVDVIKFQTFSADKLAGKDAELVGYQKSSAGDTRTQWDLLKGLELSHDEFLRVRERCRERNIVFLSTGFDLDELHFLIDELDIPMVKIASGDLTFAPLLFEAGLSGLPVVLSTGMANLAEIETALGFIAVGVAVQLGLVDADAVPTLDMREAVWQRSEIRDALKERVTILHCTTEYPAPLSALNLRAMNTIADAWGIPVGYSDHSLGSAASTAAVALGAVMIEKHFTLDKNLEGPDHAASLSPVELVDFVGQLRSVDVALGGSVKECQPVELSARASVRRSLVTTTGIAMGHVFTESDLECRRPGAGRTSFEFWDVVGTAATRDYAAGDYVE